MSRLASRESAALRLKQINLTQFILRFKELIITTFIISIFVSVFLYFLIHYFLSANVDKNNLSLIIISIPFYLVSFIFRGFLEGENSFFTVNIIKIFSSLIAFGIPIFQFIIFGQINYLWITYILIISRVIISLYVIVSKFSVFSIFFNSNSTSSPSYGLCGEYVCYRNWLSVWVESNVGRKGGDCNIHLERQNH